MSDINVSVDAGKNITQLLEKLAAQMGVTVDKVWPWLVKQQVIEGWTSVAGLVLALVVSLVTALIGLRYGRKAKWEDGAWLFAAIPGCIVCCAVFFIAIISTGDVVSKIANPEYHAMRALVQMVKP